MPGRDAFALRSRVRSCAQGVDKSGDWTSARRARIVRPPIQLVRIDQCGATTGGGTTRGRPTRGPGARLEPRHRRPLRLVPAVRRRHLSSQQRAFLRLTRPLGLIDGTALLAAPSEFAKDAIERILRLPISEALGRHLGVAVTLAVVVDASAASGGSEVPDPVEQRGCRQRHGRQRSGTARPRRTTALD